MVKIFKNRILYSLAGIFVFVLLSFVFTKTAFAELTWRYEQATNVQTEICGYPDEASCNAKLESLYPGEGLKCTLTDVPCNYSLIPVSDVKFKDTYTLLAPIGQLKDIRTNDIGKYFNTVFLIAIGLAGALAVIMIIIAGVQWMGTDSVFGKTEAKKQITGAIFGLIIALGAFALLNTIDPALLGTKGLNVDQVEIELEQEQTPWSTYSSGGNLELCPEGFIDVQDGSGGKINVCKKIESDLIKLIAAAKKDGIILSGYGSRSTSQQRQLRKEHNCPDIENSPSEDCKPPTARPGKSMHESGMAIDFKCNGESMEKSGGKNSPCFKWLSNTKNNKFLKNLASESWHWSTTGK